MKLPRCARWRGAEARRVRTTTRAVHARLAVGAKLRTPLGARRASRGAFGAGGGGADVAATGTARRAAAAKAAARGSLPLTLLSCHAALAGDPLGDARRVARSRGALRSDTRRRHHGRVD